MAVIIVRGRGVNVSRDNRSTLEPRTTSVITDQQVMAVTAADKVDKREPVPGLKAPA